MVETKMALVDVVEGADRLLVVTEEIEIEERKLLLKVVKDEDVNVVKLKVNDETVMVVALAVDSLVERTVLVVDVELAEDCGISETAVL